MRVVHVGLFIDSFLCVTEVSVISSALCPGSMMSRIKIKVPKVVITVIDYCAVGTLYKP